MFSSLVFVMLQFFGLWLVVIAVALMLIFWGGNRIWHKRVLVPVGFAIIGVLLFTVGPYLGSLKAAIPLIPSSYGTADDPALPLANILKFFNKMPQMERPDDIARDPNEVPSPITRREPAHLQFELNTREVVAEMANGIQYNYWTYDAAVPGPLLRMRVGDTADLTIKNDKSSVHKHSIDLHAVTGPGGGAAISSVAPGKSKTFTFKALNPGLYIYHCASPNVAVHMAHGMYGLILVEPAEGLPKVDHEFYVVQGEFYTTGLLGKKGLQLFDANKMLNSQPQYIVFNGRTGGAAAKMKIKTGDSVRLFVGNGGVNLISSFHVIGEIFDEVYPEGSMGPGTMTLKNVQSTIVPAGGSTIVEFKVEVPGKNVLVDHALARLDRGAWGTIEAEGPPRPDIYKGILNGTPPPATTHEH